jgi:hypothetical protein
MTRMLTAFVLVLLITPTLSAQDTPRTDGWVVLSIDEYRALRARAFPTPPEPAPPPVDATLTRVDYDLHVIGDIVTGQARLTIDVLKQGWAAVQVPGGILVRGAAIDGRSVALVDGNPPRVLLPHAGRTTLSLDVAIPLSSSAGTESVTIPPSGSALTAATLAIPRVGVELSVGGGVVAEQHEAANETRWIVYGAPGRGLTFSWKRKADDRRATLPLRTRARVTELIALGEDASQVTTSVTMEVTQGLARQVLLDVPAPVIVNQVSGANVGDWSMEGNILTVTLLEPAVSDTAFVVQAETRAPRDGAIAIPLLRVPAAERETGGVAVDVVGAGEIGDRQPRGLQPADPSDLGDVVAGHESPSMAAFQFAPLAGSAPRALTVHVSRYTPQAVLVANVEEARYDALVGEDGKLLVRARYAVRNNQRSFLAVRLPAQSTLWSASLAGQPVRPGVAADGGLLLPLRKGRSGEEAPTFAVELFYLQRVVAWSEKGTAEVQLPAVDVPVSRTGVTFRYSPRFSVEAKPGAFRPATDTGPFSAALQVRDLEFPPPPPPAPPQSAAGGVMKDEKTLQMLVDRVAQDALRGRPGVVPVTVVFPDIGPSLFLAAELTAESQAPSFVVDYHRTGGRS